MRAETKSEGVEEKVARMLKAHRKEMGGSSSQEYAEFLFKKQQRVEKQKELVRAIGVQRQRQAKASEEYASLMGELEEQR